MDDLHGFKVAQDAPVISPVDVGDATRTTLIRMVAAIGAGATPEEIHCYLQDGWPQVVIETLDRDGEQDELSAHVDLLVGVVRSAAAS